MNKALMFAVLFTFATPLVHAKPSAAPLSDAIKGGKFNYVSPKVTKVRFPPDGLSTAVSRMRTVTSKDLGVSELTTANIEAAIGSGCGEYKDYRSATLPELLAYAKAKWNGRDLVVALGSHWVDPATRHRYVPSLLDARGRSLVLDWDNPKWRWYPGHQFLIVRK